MKPEPIPKYLAAASMPKSRSRWQLSAWVRRTLLLVLVMSQSLAGTYFMIAVLPYHGGNAVEKGLGALFCILFTWISVGFWTALFGFIQRRLGGDRQSLMHRHRRQLHLTPLAPTAVVMPIYHEPVERSLGGLKAIYRSLERSGQLEHFDFYILSDSRDPEVWLEEQAAWQQLCQDLGAANRLFYRRRSVNLNYKSGNIADFLRRWGRKYRYMIVLDADSLIAGDTLVQMVRLMEREPSTGILQTSPSLINARSFFARIQQFANAVYGPIFTTGLAWVQLGEAAYWGHNACIRVEPFMAHCGLRQLPGAGLFGGSILSHDFVEAAYMGRAGQEVWLEPALTRSYEESPPTLVDELARDKRWAKGNLQHLWLLFMARGLRLAHRMAFLNGIMSYLASPLWLAFLVLTTIETTRLTLWPINYFPKQHSLFPIWPEWHPEWAIGLATSTVVLLFLPKILAFLDLALSRQARHFGGKGRLLCSILMEMAVSTLLAPIRMLTHTRYVLEALLNLSLHWGGQNRSAETSWSTALIAQAPGTVVGASWAAFALWLKPLFFLWSLPVAVPLILAAPTSVLLSRISLGSRLRRLGLLLVPEETLGSPLLDELDGTRALTDRHPGLTAFEAAVVDPRRNALHASMARPDRSGLRKSHLWTLQQKCLTEGPRSLSREEITQLSLDRDALRNLNRAAWRAPPDSPWGRLLDERVRRNGEG